MCTYEMVAGTMGSYNYRRGRGISPKSLKPTRQPLIYLCRINEFLHRVEYCNLLLTLCLCEGVRCGEILPR